jgi:diaminopimelate epimerase
MRFWKMHGLGNDYVYIDARRERVPDPPRLARAVSDRHTGVGSDGLILLQAPDDPAAHVRMRIFNADGSEAEMCGNGIRCLVRLASELGEAANPMHVQTGRGTLQVAWSRAPAFEAAVSMGAPRLACADVPARVPGVPAQAEVIGWRLPESFWQGARAPDDWRERCGLQPSLTLVSMGNPHAVFWCDAVDAVPLDVVGPFVERHAWFPQRINAHFVQAGSDGVLRMRTWERGSGITMACGTGASAVGVAAVRQGRASGAMQVRLPGGQLRIEWPGGDAPVRMTGPASHVADGTLCAELAAEAG